VPKIAFKKLISAVNPIAETPKKGVLEMGRQFFHILYILSFIALLFFFNKNKKLSFIMIAIYLAMAIMTVITYTGFRFRMPLIGLETLMLVYILQITVKAIEKSLVKKQN
jgi:hypothetical protein